MIKKQIRKKDKKKTRILSSLKYFKIPEQDFELLLQMRIIIYQSENKS